MEAKRSEQISTCMSSWFSPAICITSIPPGRLSYLIEPKAICHSKCPQVVPWFCMVHVLYFASWSPGLDPLIRALATPSSLAPSLVNKYRMLCLVKVCMVSCRLCDSFIVLLLLEVFSMVCQAVLCISGNHECDVQLTKLCLPRKFTSS
jgi:hypothetical protein